MVSFTSGELLKAGDINICKCTIATSSLLFSYAHLSLFIGIVLLEMPYVLAPQMKLNVNLKVSHFSFTNEYKGEQINKLHSQNTLKNPLVVRLLIHHNVQKHLKETRVVFVSLM